eukprot:TRINITY_DN11013_c0_g3_i1.p1 TRINITY_DN11013_c0_g3~~TRINITY_DN11013_c0_g3_i1.p1  ORF type:complete len:547 (+),score=163.24 TRINITY_DN11013_c0_g3_i1:242-1642(+)
MAESCKEAGNAALKVGDFASAASKYSEGIEHSEPLLEKTPDEIGEDLQKRGTAVYLALRLNSAQACIKQSLWVAATEHADKALLIEKDNTKALYRRGLAAVQINTEGRLEQARADFARLAQLEPSNREAREQLQKVKERLKELKQMEKERLRAAMTGGLYQDHHKKQQAQQLAYEVEVNRRKEAGEDEITFEDFLKKEKERIDAEDKKQKEAEKERVEEEQKKAEERQWQEANERRKLAGEEEISLEDWLAEEKAKIGRPMGNEVMQMDENELDEEEKELLKKTKSKGYYHGRLGTVLSDAAPKPQQVVADSSPTASSDVTGSEWNQAGTWEEKNCSSWAKERLTALLQEAQISSSDVTAKVSKVKKLEGEAHIVFVRKQAKHGYNYEAELSFNLKLGSAGSLSGTLSIPELMDAVPVPELQISTKWKGTGPSEEQRPLTTEWVPKLIECVKTQIQTFKTEYQARR